MKPVLPAKLRSAIYLVSAVVTPVMVYLADQEVVPSFWVGLYTVFVSAVNALAFANVTPDDSQTDEEL